MATPKMVPARCPTCGANLPVPPGALQLTCRYCQNVIHIEHRKPPPEVRPFGAPGAMPSRTLYVDPAATQAAKGAGCAIMVAMALPFLIAIGVGVGPWAVRSCKGIVRPFPVACGVNEEITVSGKYDGTGPVVTSVGHNCKLHIKDAKLKGAALVKTESYNMELTIEGSTIETTEPMIHSGSNMKVSIVGSKLTSPTTVFDSDSNLVLDLKDSTIESKNGTAVKAKHNLKTQMEGAKVIGKKAGFDTDANFSLTMKKASEVKGSDGVAIETTSSFKLEAEGGKIDGGLVVSSGANIEATGLTITAKEKAITATSSLKLELTDGSITSSTDAAVDADSSLNITLANTKVQAATTAINCESNAKIKASKKTRIVGLQGFGIKTTSNSELILNDAAVEAGAKAFKGSVNDKMKLTQGARLAGKKGGIEAEGNFEVEATGATLEGGSGPGLEAGYNARIAFRQGILKGAPALKLDRRPSSLDLEGSRVDGEQKIPTR